MAIGVTSHVRLTVKTEGVTYSMEHVMNANMDGWIKLAVKVLLKTN